MACKSFIFSKRFLLVDYECYYYRRHENANTNQFKGLNYFEDINDIAHEILKLIKENDLWDYYGFTKRLILNLYRINTNYQMDISVKRKIEREFRKTLGL